jgi:hypothetical protein
MSSLDNGGKHVEVGCLCNAEYYWIFCWKLLNVLDHSLSMDMAVVLWKEWLYL